MKTPSSNSINGKLLSRAVLVLNANYAPMMVCTAKRAICMEYLDKVDILANYNDKIHSPTITYDLPSETSVKFCLTWYQEYNEKTEIDSLNCS